MTEENTVSRLVAKLGITGGGESLVAKLEALKDNSSLTPEQVKAGVTEVFAGCHMRVSDSFAEEVLALRQNNGQDHSL